MDRFRPARPGRTSAILAMLLAVQIAAMGILLRATRDGVWLLGRRLGGTCLFRRLTGLPCPTCGMTRSIVLTLHGHIRMAARLNPAGPVWVAAVVLLAAGLLWLAWCESRRRADRIEAISRRFRLLAAVEGVLFALVLSGNWIYLLARR